MDGLRRSMKREDIVSPMSKVRGIDVFEVTVNGRAFKDWCLLKDVPLRC